jgi:hypothetical protein
MEWARVLAYITGSVDQQLLLRNEYLVAENRILKAQLQVRLRLSDAERARLGEIGHRLGRKALSEVATEADIIRDTVRLMLIICSRRSTTGLLNGSTRWSALASALTASTSWIGRLPSVCRFLIGRAVGARYYHRYKSRLDTIFDVIFSA